MVIESRQHSRTKGELTLLDLTAIGVTNRVAATLEPNHDSPVARGMATPLIETIARLRPTPPIPPAHMSRAGLHGVRR